MLAGSSKLCHRLRVSNPINKTNLVVKMNAGKHHTCNSHNLSTRFHFHSYHVTFRFLSPSHGDQPIAAILNLVCKLEPPGELKKKYRRLGPTPEILI